MSSCESIYKDIFGYLPSHTDLGCTEPEYEKALALAVNNKEPIEKTIKNITNKNFSENNNVFCRL